jgi:hypothetical protein
LRRVAYADPPYPGRAKRFYGCDEVDHVELIERLQTFDGWALSTGPDNLQEILPLCPKGVFTLAWVKPNGFGASHKPPCLFHSWEPVIVSPVRDRARPKPCRGILIHLNRDKPFEKQPKFAEGVGRMPFAPTKRYRGSTHIPTSAGRKPRRFCYWIFEALNADPSDEFHDLFIGSGAVTEAWNIWRKRSTLEALMKMMKEVIR